MELIKLSSTGLIPTQINQGESIDGWDKATWVERYNEPGDFKIEAPLSAGLQHQLPLGAFVGNVDSPDFMIVENHEKKYDKDKDPRTVISGRSFFSYFDQRTVGDNIVASTHTVSDYTIPVGLIWSQIVTMIEEHLEATNDPNNEVLNFHALHTCSGTGTTEERAVKPGSLLARTIELLKLDDLGIKVFRPNTGSSSINVIVHQGVDRSADARFSWLNGDIDSLEYLKSQKNYKNYARVIGRWVQVRVDKGTPAINYNRRTLLVDGSDIDGQFNAFPAGADLTKSLDLMRARGREALAKQNGTTINSVEVAPNASVVHRRDYDVGDLVAVDGDSGSSGIFRVTEVAHIVDENGSSAQPTLALPGEG